MSKYLFFLFILIIYTELLNCQEPDKNMMRAAACISMIRKLDNKPTDQQMLSGYILSCFINIDDKTAQKLISTQSSPKLDLTEDEISKLTDIVTISQKYSQEQIMQYSEELNSVLQNMQNVATGGKRNPSQGSSYNKRGNSKPQNVGLFNNMIEGFRGIFSVNDSLLFLFGFFIVFYLFLMQIRKWFSVKDKSKTAANKKNAKSKKNK